MNFAPNLAATLAELQEIRGIGERKSKNFAARQILEAVRRFKEGARAAAPRATATAMLRPRRCVCCGRPHLRRDREDEGNGSSQPSSIAVACLVEGGARSTTSMTRGWTLAAALKSRSPCASTEPNG